MVIFEVSYPVGERSFGRRCREAIVAAGVIGCFSLTYQQCVNKLFSTMEGKEVTIRLQSYLDLSFEYSSDSDKLKENLRCEVATYCDKIQSSVTVFHVLNSSVVLDVVQPEKVHPKSVNLSEPCGKLATHIDAGNGDGIMTRSKAGDCQDPIKVSMLFRMTGTEAVKRGPSCAPIIHHEHREFKNINLTLPLDVLVSVGADEPLASLSKLLADGACSQLSEMEKNMWTYHKEEKFQCPQVFHFRLNNKFISIIYPASETEDQLEPVRQALHETYNLPLDRPLLRRSNAFAFRDETKRGGYLINPHEGLRPSGVKDGKPSLVYGRYSYHHYMQDKFDDNRWGCAYRSLQTLISWFKLQGYTDKPIPSHKEIQQALVDIGDKEPSFVGARKWIGSMEVGFCLEHFLGVTYKILNVSSGTELASKGRELAVHFETQGTPIMIGGGVLAHTILGVDFNDVSGDLKFLILDPHYTGAEDLKIIQDKGWCGWKEPSFWDQKAYYNLCMPQRPKLL